MNGWEQVSKGSLLAARLLLGKDAPWLLRSSVNRSYYAVYAAISARTPKGMSFAFDRRNPSHEQLAHIVRSARGNLDAPLRKSILRGLIMLRYTRETADYRPGLTVDHQMALECYRTARYICSRLEIEE